MACNARRFRQACELEYIKFQSLAGFFVACNSERCSAVVPGLAGFNPWRVFSWLATEIALAFQGSRLPVSIPGGFFRGLQPSIRSRTIVGLPTVSIPGGFFRGLQQHIEPRPYGPANRVSIPGGFFRGLQPRRMRAPFSVSTRFNPWRVFSWLATPGRIRS